MRASAACASVLDAGSQAATARASDAGAERRHSVSAASAIAACAPAITDACLCDWKLMATALREAVPPVLLGG